MEMERIAAIFGWMTVLNLAIYIVSVGFILIARERTAALQARLLRVPEDDWPRVYVEFLGRYKLLIIVFNLVPYLALRIVA